MKKIIHGALLAGVIPLGMAGQAFAGPLAPIVHEANYLRSSAWCLNSQANDVEKTIRNLQAQGINPVKLREKAQSMRLGATYLALESNKVAKKAFDSGYHRPNHSHPRYN